MLLFLEERGLAQVTRSKKHRSWSYSSVTSRPRKILAMNTPPGRRTWSVMLRACRMKETRARARVSGVDPKARREWQTEVAYGKKKLGLDELVKVVQAGNCNRRGSQVR